MLPTLDEIEMSMDEDAATAATESALQAIEDALDEFQNAFDNLEAALQLAGDTDRLDELANVDLFWVDMKDSL